MTHEASTDPPRSDPAGGADSSDRRRNPIRRRDPELDRMDRELNLSAGAQALIDAGRSGCQALYGLTAPRSFVQRWTDAIKKL